MYLMKGMAVLAMGLVAASCNKMDFSGQPEISDEEVMENAEMALGFEINPNQDWNMTKQVSGSVTVSLGYEPNYICENCGCSTKYHSLIGNSM